MCQDEGSHQDAGGGGHVTRDGSTGAVDITGDATTVQVQFVGVQEAHCGQGSFSVSYQHRGVLYFFNYLIILTKFWNKFSAWIRFTTISQWSRAEGGA